MSHVFVDESKARDYLLISAVVVAADLGQARRAIRALTLPGQPRLHMKKESNRRRRQILTTIDGLAPEVTIYRAGTLWRTELERRDQCLHALVADIADQGHTYLCLERDASLVGRDRQQLIEATRATGCADRLSYRHESATAEPLLAIPDAVGWAWARGGDWRRRCEKVVTDTINL